eukprot:GILJ01006486.1.p1 GENE.GILJ01006486.1~~GILJ01006486.1.p1  ORF type:complete len:374 (+),score=79.98 GILJ01006486.1:59-1180(+)
MAKLPLLVLLCVGCILLTSAHKLADDAEAVVVSTAVDETQENVDLETASVPEPVDEGPKTYYIEACAIVFIVVYILQFFMGKSANDNFAKAWVRLNKDLFTKNFAYLGFGEKDQEALILREAYHCFKFYGSGRLNCDSFTATLNLKKRQDLLSVLLFDMIWPSPDTCVIDIALDAMDPICLAVAKKKNAKNLHQNSPDLKIYTRQRNFAALPPNFVVFAESNEALESVLVAPIVSTLKEFEKYFVSLHITDEHPYLPQKRNLHLEFTLPPLSKLDDVSQLTRMALYLTDLVANVKLSATTKAAADRERLKVAEENMKAKQAERVEKLQQKKIDEKRKRDEETANLSKEAQRKREEREYRESLKKKGPKVKMIR